MLTCVLLHQGQHSVLIPWQTPQGFPLYDWVAQHPTGLVAVSITYRLGMMGFLGE